MAKEIKLNDEEIEFLNLLYDYINIEDFKQFCYDEDDDEMMKEVNHKMDVWQGIIEKVR